MSASGSSKWYRFDEELTRVMVHLHDDNAGKAGADDKRCQIEARPKGQQPVSVTHKAESLDFAVDGAIHKLKHALSHQFGKLRNRRAQAPLLNGEVDAIENQDTLLEEDFLAEQQVRSA